LKKSNKLVKGIGLGVAIGTAIGVALKSIPIGIGIGLVFAAGSIKKSKK
jgi:hypothetical protein